MDLIGRTGSPQLLQQLCKQTKKCKRFTFTIHSPLSPPHQRTNEIKLLNGGKKKKKRRMEKTKVISLAAIAKRLLMRLETATAAAPCCLLLCD
jgi:hypothetical protein